MSDHERMLELEARVLKGTATLKEIEECAYDRGWHAGFHAALGVGAKPEAGGASK